MLPTSFNLPFATEEIFSSGSLLLILAAVAALLIGTVGFAVGRTRRKRATD